MVVGREKERRLRQAQQYSNNMSAGKTHMRAQMNFSAQEEQQSSMLPTVNRSNTGDETTAASIFKSRNSEATRKATHTLKTKSNLNT